MREILNDTRLNPQYDQNFDTDTLNKITDYLDNPDVQANPHNYKTLIDEMRIEAGLICGNSPYAMVRAVVDPFDNPELPSFTFRVWFIGIIYAGTMAFVNQLFTNRNPAIYVGSNVAQFLAYPAGKLLEAILPTKKFTIRGWSFTLNPGRFNHKEQMLITIMANAAAGTPYTNSIVFVQILPRYFNQPWARSYGYQILNTLASSFIGIVSASASTAELTIRVLPVSAVASSSGQRTVSGLAPFPPLPSTRPSTRTTAPRSSARSRRCTNGRV